jgi:hypothetical protein
VAAASGAAARSDITKRIFPWHEAIQRFIAQ